MVSQEIGRHKELRRVQIRKIVELRGHRAQHLVGRDVKRAAQENAFVAVCADDHGNAGLIATGEDRFHLIGQKLTVEKGCVIGKLRDSVERMF